MRLGVAALARQRWLHNRKTGELYDVRGDDSSLRYVCSSPPTDKRDGLIIEGLGPELGRLRQCGCESQRPETPSPGA
jgi:hypothetical protein